MGTEEAKEPEAKKKEAKESISDSDSDSSSSEKKKKTKKKDKKKDKKKKDKKGKKGKDKKSKKADKKGAKKKNKANRDCVSTQFGKFGVIKPEDFYNKKPEFLCWAIEVRKENTDVMCQMDMKNLFKEYIEDYNTATMPTKKYYNLQTWDTLLSKKRQANNRGKEMSDAAKGSMVSFDDEKARREEIKHIQAKKQEDQITNEVRRMRTDKTKVSEMKSQTMLKTK